jgi:hypothetical protein
MSLDETPDLAGNFSRSFWEFFLVDLCTRSHAHGKGKLYPVVKSREKESEL